MEKAQRFQPFVEDWSYPNNYKMPEWRFAEISTVPITLIGGTEDTASYPKRVAWLAPQLKTLHGYYQMEGWDHMTFVENSSQEYIDLIMSELFAEPGSVANPELQTINLSAASITSSLTATFALGLAFLKMLF